MLLQPKTIVGLTQVTKRTFKNFGHKRQPIPMITTLWHGSLTFTFIGMCLNWDKFKTWMFGEDLKKLVPDWDDNEST